MIKNKPTCKVGTLPISLAPKQEDLYSMNAFDSLNSVTKKKKKEKNKAKGKAGPGIQGHHTTAAFVYVSLSDI